MPNFWYSNYQETARPLNSSWHFAPAINIGMPIKILSASSKTPSSIAIGGYVGSKCCNNDEKREQFPLGKIIRATLESHAKLCNHSSQQTHLMRNLIPNLIQTAVTTFKFDIPLTETVEKQVHEFDIRIPDSTKSPCENIAQGLSFEIHQSPKKQEMATITSQTCGTATFAIPVGEKMENPSPVLSPCSEISKGCDVPMPRTGGSFCKGFSFEIPFCDNMKKLTGLKCSVNRRLSSESSVDSDCVVFEGCDETSDDQHDFYNDVDSDSDDDNIYFSWALQVAAEDSLKPSPSSQGSCPVKKVRFKSAPEVRVMRVWDFASRSARLGPWERAARDRERFKKRIEATESILNPILCPQHRDRIWTTLQQYR